MAFARLHAAIDSLGLAPGLRQMRARAHDRWFNHNLHSNLFRGVYPTFEAALAAAPPHQPHDFDHEAAASMYSDLCTRICDYDYAPMFWLQRSFAQGMRQVFDLGGHVGIKYYAFRGNLWFDDEVRWTVGDLPAVVSRGKAMALERDPARRLRFTERLEEMDGAEVLFASGSLQYLPMTLGQLLARLRQRPQRIIVNITPIHDEMGYFTVNSVGTAYCPYRVQHRATFVDEVRAQGYVLHDQWLNPGKGLELPFNPGYGLTAYSGFCFDLA